MPTVMPFVIAGLLLLAAIVTAAVSRPRRRGRSGPPNPRPRPCPR